MPTFKDEAALLYNNGIFGSLGYAVPNFGEDPQTLNEGIAELVEMMGRNLSAIMHHQDADSRVPPSINTLTRIHMLVVRARQIMAGRAVPSSTPNMETQHAAPATQDFLIFPVPFFKVRNRWLKNYCSYVLIALTEAMQHTENRNPIEFSTQFTAVVGQWLYRLYRQMSTELFMVDPTKAADLSFTLQAADLAAYAPAKFFTSTEMIDTRATIDLVPTAYDIRVLTNGIPASQLVNLCKYPSGEAVPTIQGPATDIGADGKPVATTAPATATSANATQASFQSPPVS